jgi:hypothetical protein
MAITESNGTSHQHFLMLNNLIGFPSFVGCVVVVEKLAAELEIEFVIKFLDPPEDGLALLGQIAFVVKTRSQHRQKSLYLMEKRLSNCFG